MSLERPTRPSLRLLRQSVCRTREARVPTGHRLLRSGSVCRVGKQSAVLHLSFLAADMPYIQCLLRVSMIGSRVLGETSHRRCLSSGACFNAALFASRTDLDAEQCAPRSIASVLHALPSLSLAGQRCAVRALGARTVEMWGRGCGARAVTASRGRLVCCRLLSCALSCPQMSSAATPSSVSAPNSSICAHASTGT